jgi:2-succinyl-5-enolpyruvyl-6-hydroxy-3-cyclohexene-1-carboxylate synthase
MDSSLRQAASQSNLAFGRLIIGALERLGVTHFHLSPGSRSTPLALALAELGGERFTVSLDERSAAFQALGRIKATRRPAAFICTSGTAGAHAYPAVIEASECGLPLLVLTADRPPELRHCHAGQTIDQTRIYGAYARYYAEMPLPETDRLLARQVREICRVLVERAMGAPPGPVQVNCPFREPFFPDSGTPSPFDWESLIGELLSGLEPVVRPTMSLEVTASLPERTIILAGPRPGMEPKSECDAIRRFAIRYRIPVLADGASPLRQVRDPDFPVIIHYDRMARDECIWKDLRPECVLLWGEPPTSKVLRQRLMETDIRGYLAGSGNPVMNPVHGGITYAGESMAGLLDGLTAPGREAYLTAWAGRDRYFELFLREAMSTPHDLFEGDLHRDLLPRLPEGLPLVMASSMAVRDADWFLPKWGPDLLPFSQRGANGIDGTVSMARGIAAGTGKPAVLVIGDLAFLHDSNGLLGASGDRQGLLVLMVDNGGGGIFEFLPVAERSPAFRDLFLTPQEVDFRALVEAHGGRYTEVSSVDQALTVLDRWDRTGVTVVRIRIDRTASIRLHRRFLTDF